MTSMVELALWTAVLMVAGGILMLALGASWLVDGASRLALRLGVAPMIVGITVVGFGTSLPEFSVSVLAATRGSGGLSVGNAVGSNIMNLLLVLGVSSMLYPISVVGDRRLVRRDLVFGVVPAVVLLVLAWDGYIGRGTAVILLGLFVAFMLVCVRQGREEARTRTIVAGGTGRHIAVAAVGSVVLVIGAELMVRGGVSVALSFGISEAVIGLTLVAFGTSLPELAASVVAALKHQSEISVGNVLGSNVFNLGLIVGTAFMIRPNTVPVFVIRHDVPLLVLATAAVGIFVLRDGRISRRQGAALVGLFTAYLVFLAVRGG